MRKKMWFVFLMILSLSIICAVSAAEKSGTCGKDGDNLTWKLSDQGVLTISGSGDMVDYNKEILPPWLNDPVKKIVIGSEVTSIGNGAFLNAATTEVRIPKNSKLTRIGEYAFSFNVHLTKFTIPSKVKIIANGAFGCCLALQRIDIPSSVTSIGSGAFEGCSALNTLMIGKKVKNIGYRAFFACFKLDKIVIKTKRLTNKTIGAEAFTNAGTALTVTCPRGLMKTYKKLLTKKGISKDAKFQ